MNFLSRMVSLILSVVLVYGPLYAQSPAVAPPSPSIGAPIPMTPVQSLRLQMVEESKGANGVPQVLAVQVRDQEGNLLPDVAVTFRLPEEGASGTFRDGKRAAVAYSDQAGIARVGEIQWNTTPGTVPVRVTAVKGIAHAGLLMEEQLHPAGASVAALPPPLQKTAPPVPTAPAAKASAKPPAVNEDAKEESDADTRAAHKVAADENERETASAGPLSPRPSVSVTHAGSSGASLHTGSSKKKWIILAAVVAAGAAGGLAFASSRKSSTTTPAASGLTIGTPTISIGHP